MAGTCPRETVSVLADKLTEWSHHFDEVEKEAFSEHGCGAPEVFCLDRFGEALGDTLPDRVSAGSTFTVEVIAPALDSGKLALSTSVRAKTAVAAGPFDVDKGPPSATIAPAGSTPPPCDLTRAGRDMLRAAAGPIALLGARPGLEAIDIPAGSWD